MPIAPRVRVCLLACALLPACSGSSASATDELVDALDGGWLPDGAASLDAGPDAVSSSDAAQPDGGEPEEHDAGWTPGMPATCEQPAISCRGACLSEPGDHQNACELVLPGELALDAIIRHGDALLATTRRGKVLRISLPDLSVTELAQLDDRADPREPLQVVDDHLYFRADGDGTELHRVPVAGGAAELVLELSPAPDQDVGYLVADGHVYVLGGGVDRVPLAGGAREELLSGTAHAFVPTLHHFYYVGGLIGRELLRAPRSSPADAERLVLQANGAMASFASALAHWPDDPDHVYAVSGPCYFRIAASTGSSECLAELAEPLGLADRTDSHLIVGRHSTARELSALERRSGELEPLDTYVTGLTFQPSSIVVTDDYFYVARLGALLRLAR
jgi:hypothetical protein